MYLLVKNEILLGSRFLSLVPPTSNGARVPACDQASSIQTTTSLYYNSNFKQQPFAKKKCLLVDDLPKFQTHFFRSNLAVSASCFCLHSSFKLQVRIGQANFFQLELATIGQAQGIAPTANTLIFIRVVVR
jgi:hypothetical protein